VTQFCDWVLEQARVTRLAIGDADVSRTEPVGRTGQGAGELPKPRRVP